MPLCTPSIYKLVFILHNNDGELRKLYADMWGAAAQDIDQAKFTVDSNGPFRVGRTLAFRLLQHIDNISQRLGEYCCIAKSRSSLLKTTRRCEERRMLLTKRFFSLEVRICFFFFSLLRIVFFVFQTCTLRVLL